MTGLQTSGETHASNAVRENHRNADSHMLPCAQVVASPHGSVPLGTSIEGTGKDEGTFVRGRPLFDSLRGDVHEKHAVDVVNISVFPTTIVN